MTEARRALELGANFDQAALRVELDQALLEQAPGRALEGFLAQPEHLTQLLRARVVTDQRRAWLTHDAQHELGVVLQLFMGVGAQ